ncbi:MULTISPECIES: aspartate/glutamate racemase family protein [unclassified Paenibacillus]|uniref:aspartate/glutamate racemase family protein n=1 Tax=unclassified Paenibacillus TaxID=185978 RepID=UPI002405B32C|nr:MULTISPECIES: aspartate/glutamate racemase family protein [unclassified Paenibacillus]MDF9844508.1 allantoin racemase [Paenibacillus sp. PastF-2]MDF9851112.1 allantoin racemase [Paenibacillus sp. PastM-2]MDF9857684.1 allantoin racemase [Paenibacillus sp. PastF-1]MDH6482950.1 allantoin racemase [Paenibacillus sp. PastH-2]MDH6510375.1 allantoin racemase [Paenibacillus sp. PastM-3]
MKIKVINPNTTWEMTRGIEHAAKSAARPGTEILAVSPEMGPVSIESYYDEYLAIPGVLQEIQKGEAEGIDAYVIACYGDPGLQAARELTKAPVIGIAEASLYMASMLAARFSIVTVLPRIKTMLEELVTGYGMDHRVVQIRTTPLGVLDFERDPVRGMEILAEEGRRAVEEDYAEAILLGCAGMAEFADRLEQELGVPVFDGVVAAVKFAESIVDLGKKTSKLKTYKYPEKKKFAGVLSSFE